MHEYLEAVHVLNGVTAQNKHLDEFEMKPFCQQICYGVSRNYYSLGYLTSKLVNKPLPAKHHDLFLLLLAGLYSIDNLHRPVHTSVNAAVEATVGLKKPWAKGLINGVLRRYIRERDTLPKPDPNENSGFWKPHSRFVGKRASSQTHQDACSGR